MFMHPEAQHESLQANEPPINQDQLLSALGAINNQAPYLTTALWRGDGCRGKANQQE
jgi:hypothetical protein